MRTRDHIVYGLIFTFIFQLIFNPPILNSAILFLSTWLFIDLDHVLRYFLKTGNLNPISFFKVHKTAKESWKKIPKKQKSRYKKPHFLFHGIEFLLIIFLLSQVWEIFYFVLMGTIFHLILDHIEIAIKKENPIFKISQIATLIYNQGKLKRKNAF